MRGIAKALMTGGLALMAGPLSFAVLAQGGYVDVEAERAAARAGDTSTVPDDPYGARPAQAYPSTSFGVGSSATMSGSPAPTGSAYPAAEPAATTSTAGVAGGNLASLFSQIQQLQQEVMRLNGKVEEQAYEIAALKEQSLQRYMDLDQRLGGGAAASTVAAPSSSAPPPAPAAEADYGAPMPTVAAPIAQSQGAPGVERPGEAEAYQAAYGLVQGRQFDQAVSAFQQFLRDYPEGKYAANAHYWLGELYLVIDPPDLESSRQAFALLLSEYPDNVKAPDALYKLGKVQFMKGNREKAREYMDKVIALYGNTDNAVVQLAREFIAENY